MRKFIKSIRNQWLMLISGSALSFSVMPQPGSLIFLLLGWRANEMQNQSTQMRNPLNVLAGVLLVLSVYTAQLAIADDYSVSERRTFTIQSLQGSYAYVNNSAGVASFGPMIFDGKGRLTLKDKVNLPCDSSGVGCTRSVTNLTGEGTYTVNPDGTGVATITFTESNGTVRSPADVFDFVISKATWNGRTLLATQIFAADQFGGLAGQLVAPTWTRISK